MKSLVGHMNVCPWPWCRGLIRGGQHLTKAEAHACDMFTPVTAKRRGDALIVNLKDFVAWEKAA